MTVPKGRIVTIDMPGRPTSSMAAEAFKANIDRAKDVKPVEPFATMAIYCHPESLAEFVTLYRKNGDNLSVNTSTMTAVRPLRVLANLTALEQCFTSDGIPPGMEQFARDLGEYIDLLVGSLLKVHNDRSKR